MRMVTRKEPIWIAVIPYFIVGGAAGIIFGKAIEEIFNFSFYMFWAMIPVGVFAILNGILGYVCLRKKVDEEQKG